MNHPYYYYYYPTIDHHQPAVHNYYYRFEDDRGWVSNNLMTMMVTPNYAVFNPQPPSPPPVEYVDQVVILNTNAPFTYYDHHVHPLAATIDQQQQQQQQQSVDSSPIWILDQMPEEESLILDRSYGNLYHDPLEDDDDSWWRELQDEEILVFEELPVNNNNNNGGIIITGSGGLSEETITRRLLQAARSKGELYESDDVCAICLDGYYNDDDEDCKKMGIRLECGHGYHSQCIKTWLLRKNVCPMCKAPAFTI